MRKGLVTFVVILMTALAVLAEKTIEQQAADLEEKLKRVSGREKIQVLNELAYLIYETYPEKCIAYGSQALKLSRGLNVKKEEGTALKNIGFGYGALGEKAKELEYVQQALTIFETINDRECTANALTAIGVFYYEKAQYHKAVEYYSRSLKITLEIGDKKGINHALNNIGIVYYYLNDWEKALEYYCKSLEIDKELGDKRGMADSYLNIALVYQQMGKKKLAEDHYLKSLKTSERLGDKIRVSNIYSNLGTFYSEVLEDNQKAKAYFLKSLQMAEQLDSKHQIAQATSNLGIIYFKEKKYDQSIRYLRKSLDLAKEIDLRDIIMRNYDYFSDLYAAKGDYKQALEYHKLYSEIHEKIFDERLNKRISKYETEKKEMEIQALKKENQIKSLENKVQIIIGVSLIAALLMILIIIYRYYKYYKGQLKHKNERQKSLQLEAKLKLFQARINPHFLFNSLNSIIGLGYENNPGKLKETIKKLSNIYRNILSSPETFTVPLKKELDVVRDYLEVEKKILSNRLDYNFSISDEELLGTEIIPQSILTLVENAVKHGISKKQEGGTITVHIYLEDQSIIIEIIDTGIGFDMGRVKPGFGLYSIQERLKLFYNGKARFRIGNLAGGGTRAVMQIPYHAA